ncbi:hypothetical protein BKA70DRAFT_1223606 [Coprinopsis sp. MPI-PUGE-AT-0042]|nr:hypothetical protein BKA70DRAFT_1223606 [Coprinopsis sp. MPI-PUGE-AT-0042]
MSASLSSSSRHAIICSCLRRILASRTGKKRKTFDRQVLHYDFHSGSLMIWFWPVYNNQDKAVRDDPRLENAQVPPSDLEEYAREHELRAPCCLCALIDDVPYTESKIRLAGPEGSRTGTYVAECAMNRCGYYVYLEDFYTLLGLRVRKYALREVPTPEMGVLPATRVARRWVMKTGREGGIRTALLEGDCPVPSLPMVASKGRLTGSPLQA